MLDRDRRSAAAAVARALKVELEIRRVEIAALERASDIAERARDEYSDRCDVYRPDSTCTGTFTMRWCRTCGAFTVTRCEIHGGSRAADDLIAKHRAEHGGEDARRPKAQDEIGLSPGSKAVPVGGVQQAPAPGGDHSARDRQEAKRATDNAPNERSEQHTQRSGPSQGPAVQRRRRIGKDVD